MFNIKKWTVNAPIVSMCMIAFLCVSATLSLAERIVAKDVPLRGIQEVEAGDTWLANRWVEIGPSKYGHFITRIDINGAQVAALIDTGASVVALSYEDAERAGLNPFRLKFDRKVSTANGIA
ncbi:MAG: retropepsin-like aspartic protease family protein, partial [Aestuariivirgaceae bacterium]